MSIAKVCAECGSDQVSIEAFVGWDAGTQEFVVHDMCDKGHSCNECGGECNVEDITIPSTPDEAITALEDLAQSFIDHWVEDEDEEEQKRARHDEARMHAAVALLRREIAAAKQLREDIMEIE